MYWGDSMGSKNKISKFLYKLIINILVNYFFIMLIMEALQVENNLLISLIIVGVSVVSILFWRLMSKKPAVIIGIMVTLTLAISYMYYYQNETYMGILNNFSEFINWSSRFMTGLTFLHDVFFNILLSLIVFILSLITSFLIYKSKGVYVLMTLGTLVFIVRWFQYSDSAIIYGVFYIIFILMLFTFNRYLKKEKSWEESGKEIKPNILRNWVIYSTLVCIVVVFIAAATPRNFSPVTWRWLDENLQGKMDYFAKWRNSKKTSFGYGNEMKFDLTLTGFQGEYKRLGGPVKQSNILVMVVDSDEPIYLKGRVKDFYTGSYWKSTENSYSKELKGVTNSLYDDKLDGENVIYTVTHKNIVTSTLFSTYVPKVYRPKSSYYYLTNEYEAFSNQVILKDDSYTVFSVKPYIDWDVVYKSKYVPKEGFEKYLQLPATVPSRIYDFAYSLAISTGSNSDFVKAKKIETYLRNNHEYTLEPPETPHNKDFVDYFIYDLREGYCTYFASSMVVLARAAGIPARYVEGFKVSNDKKNKSGQYLVDGRDAHAWAEVYIEGYGWMIFEATPRYSDVTYEEKIEVEQPDKEAENNSNTGPVDRELDEFKEPGFEDESFIVGEFNGDEIQTQGKLALRIILYALLSAVALIILKMLYNFFRIKRLFRRIKRKELKNRVLDYYRFIMNLLNKIDKGKDDDETVLEYCGRLNLDLWEAEHKFNEATDIFNKARYSDEGITDEEFDKIKEYYWKTEKNVKNKIGALKFAFYKYFSMGVFK